MADNVEYTQITPEYVYLTIPADYVCVYHKLLTYIADFGKNIIDDCSASCKGNVRQILNCWSLFQSAVACHALGKEEEATFFINYITTQLNNLYKGTGEEQYSVAFPVTISEDGILKAIVTCGEESTFSVDPDTGYLYEQYTSASSIKNYYIENNDLLVKLINSSNSV